MAPASRQRVVFAAAGALAGVAGWLMADVVPDALNSPRGVLALATGLGAFFFVLLFSLGPLSLGRATAAAAGVAGPATALMLLASYRFDDVRAFLETGHPIVALLILVTLPVPYLAAGLGAGRRWMDYALLFDAAWAALVRGLAALAFLLVAWAVIWLSDMVLKIVGITIIEDALDLQPVPWIVTGLLFGLALAVADELAEVVSPHLPLRLLRLLAPPVLAVMALFLAALPFRGLSDLFGNLSAAGTLMAMAVAAATLVSAALDRDDAAAATGMIRRTAAGLALLLPFIAALAVIAVSERVGQYGWTPDRLAASVAAALLMAYGIVYAAAVLGRAGWMRRIRWANTRLGLLAIALAAIWLSPLLDAQRISVASQIARFEAGRTGADALDLWSIGREWGRAGQRGISELADLEHPDADVLRSRIEKLPGAADRRDFEADFPQSQAGALRDALLSDLTVLPAGTVPPAGLFDAISVPELRQWRDACDRLTPLGNPGCVLVLGDFAPDAPGEEAMLFTLVSDEFASATGLLGAGRGRAGIAGDLGGFSRADTLDGLVSGDVTIETKRLNVLRFGDSELFLLP